MMVQRARGAPGVRDGEQVKGYAKIAYAHARWRSGRFR